MQVFAGAAQVLFAALGRHHDLFQGARLADVANVLIGGTLIGGAAAFASYIVA